MVYDPKFLYKVLALVGAAVAAGALAVYTIAEEGGVVKELIEAQGDADGNPVGFC